MHKKILAIAVPLMLANLSTPLLGMVDTVILGHLDSEIYLGAVAIGSQLITLVFWSFGFLRMGTTGFAARGFGSEDSSELILILKRALFIAVVASFVVLVCQSFSLPLLIRLLVDQSDIYALSLSYAQIRVWGAPAALVTYALVGWLIGIQRTKAAMGVLISLNLINIILDYIFVVRLGWLSDGAAWASLISECIGAALAIVACVLAAKKLNLDFSEKLVVSFKSLADMLNSSRHLFVRTLCLLFCFLYFTAQGETLGTNTLAANAILLNLLAFTAHIMDGFAYTAETLGGEAWGAKNHRRFVKVVRYTWVWAIGLGVLCALILVFGKPIILGLYTDLELVTNQAEQDYLWIALLPLIAVHCYQLDGIFVGTGKTLSMQNAMLASCFFVFLPAWYFMKDYGNTGLWLAFWAFHIARSLFLLPQFRVMLRKIA